MPEREKSAETRRAEAETLICLMTSLSAVLKQLTGTIVPQMLEVEVDLLQVVKRHGYLAVMLVALQLYFASVPPPPWGGSLFGLIIYLSAKTAHLFSIHDLPLSLPPQGEAMQCFSWPSSYRGQLARLGTKCDALCTDNYCMFISDLKERLALTFLGACAH